MKQRLEATHFIEVCKLANHIPLINYPALNISAFKKAIDYTKKLDTVTTIAVWKIRYKSMAKK